MTGPEHYREAERLMAKTPDPMGMEPDDVAPYALLVAQAQAHATLALAAATALTGPVAASVYEDQPDVVVWAEAAGVKP